MIKIPFMLSNASTGVFYEVGSGKCIVIAFSDMRLGSEPRRAGGLALTESSDIQISSSRFQS
jgi:hypothetical protein